VTLLAKGTYIADRSNSWAVVRPGRYSRIMSITPPSERALRPAEVVQAEIRALMQETGGWLWGPTRARYEQLRDEWVAAMRGEVAAAA
jgi:hypothetical protein